MSNADIFGYQESVSGEIDGNRVLVKKRHQRSVRDAAVPPGQSINFEFYVAAFPFELIVTDGGAGIGTTARTTSSSSGGSRAGAGGRRAAAAARVASAAATSRSRAGRRVSDRGAGSASSGPLPVTIAARRRPMGPWEPGLGDLVIDPEPPPPPPDWEVPFEITLTPPNGLAALIYTRPKSSEIRRWPTETARIDPLYLERGRGKWQISVKNINDVSKRIEILLESIHAITPISQQDIPLSLLNFLSSVALQKASPTIRYINGDVVVMTPSPFLDLMGVDRTLDLPSVVGSVVESLPTYTPISAQLMSRTDFIARIEDRKAKINEAFIERIQRVGPGDPRVASWNSDRQNAIEACDASIGKLRNLSDELAAYCLVLEGMFTNPEVDLRYIVTVVEIDNQIPQIGLVFDRWLRFTNVFSNLAVDLSPLLSKIAIGTAALALLSGPVLGPLAILGGVLLYNSIADVDVEEKIRQQIRDRGESIAGYVRRALERITDLGAVALDAQVIPDAAADGSDVLRILYFNPSTARPPRPMRPIDGAIAPINEVLEIGNGDVEPRPRLGLTHVMDTPRSARRGTRAIAREIAADDGPLIDIDTEPAGQLPSAFVVQDPETLARLDDHECIAIVMMENRSFDHFFHDLSTVYPGRGYQAVPASYRNPPPPGFGEPMMPIRNTSIGLGNNLIFLPGSRSADPNHNKEHTYFQLGGGTEATQGTGDMLGFAADFAKESDSPQIVMSYLALDDLPVLKAVAGQYPVCDRWFAALPVGTYPNRLSSL